jgi:hypothetical protein
LQYQEFLLTINIFLIVLILAFIKDNYTRKLYIAATICAYVLAALLPYLLARSTLSVTILFYALVIGFISFFTYDQYKSAMNRTYVEAAADNEQGSISKTELPAGEESVVQPELPTAEIEAIAEGVSSDKGELPVLIGAAQIPADVKQVDEHRTVLETVQTEEPEEPAGEPESPLPDDIPADVAPPPRDAEADIHTAKEAGAPETALPDDIPADGAPPPQDTGADIHTAEEADVPETALPDDISADVAPPPQDTGVDIHTAEEADVPETALPGDIPATEAPPPEDTGADIHTAEEAGAPETPPPDDIPAAEAPPPEDTGVEPLTDDSEDRMIEEAVAQAVYDIEHLIDLAFEARARGDYHGTLTILETILEQDPPEEIVDLILDDVEVLFAKLVS